MKTIEERAQEYLDRPAKAESYHREIEQAYIDGATEQKRIDLEGLEVVKDTYFLAGSQHAKEKTIEKACEWLNNVRWTDYVHCDNDVVSVGVHKLAVAFRKAVEE